MREENGEYTYKWNPDEDVPILKITKSSLGSFQFCPINYKYGYLDDIKQKGVKIDVEKAKIFGKWLMLKKH